MSDKNRILYDLPREQYDKLPGMNWSRLKHIAKSPAHFNHILTNPEDDSDAKKTGRALHLAIFEAEKFRETYVKWDGGTRRGPTWEKFKLANAGFEILTEKEHEQVTAMAGAVRSSAMAAPFISGGKGEVTVQWEYVIPPTAIEQGEGRPPKIIPGRVIQCRSRLDFIANIGALVDVKGTIDASPEGFAKQVLKFGYHQQSAMYHDGHEAVTGQARPYVLVAVEKKPPYVVQVYRLSEKVMDLGRDGYVSMLHTYGHCLNENMYHGYSGTLLDLELPKWATPDDDDLSDLGLEFSDQEGAESHG